MIEQSSTYAETVLSVSSETTLSAGMRYNAYRLTVQAVGSDPTSTVVRNLRSWLKAGLRTYRLRVVEIEPVQ